jgi:hypothetical protein
LSWMSGFLDSGVLAGKIICPNSKCAAKLGNFDWAGSRTITFLSLSLLPIYSQKVVTDSPLLDFSPQQSALVVLGSALASHLAFRGLTSSLLSESIFFLFSQRSLSHQRAHRDESRIVSD